MRLDIVQISYRYRTDIVRISRKPSLCSKQNHNAKNESWEKERKPEQETRGDAEKPTETRRSPRRRAARWREKAKPTGRRKALSTVLDAARTASQPFQSFVSACVCVCVVRKKF